MLGFASSSSGILIQSWQFLVIFLLMFALFLILSGVFTAYFGSGKSRTIGVVLLVLGLLVGLGIGYYYHALVYAPDKDTVASLSLVVWESFLVILAAGLGALAAIAIFLVAIMKS